MYFEILPYISSLTDMIGVFAAVKSQNLALSGSCQY